jgi:hypothetical protein
LGFVADPRGCKSRGETATLCNQPGLNHRR